MYNLAKLIIQAAVELRCPSCDDNLGKDTENPTRAHCGNCGSSFHNDRGYTDEPPTEVAEPPIQPAGSQFKFQNTDNPDQWPITISALNEEEAWKQLPSKAHFYRGDNEDPKDAWTRLKNTYTVEKMASSRPHSKKSDMRNRVSEFPCTTCGQPSTGFNFTSAGFREPTCATHTTSKAPTTSAIRDAALRPSAAPRPDASTFISVLEDLVVQIQADTNLSLGAAKQLVIDRVNRSSIKDEDKEKIIQNVDDPSIQHIQPLNMKDQSSLIGYLFNSILKYKGLGVIKSNHEQGAFASDLESDPNEEEDMGYGGDRPGQWVSPKATISQDMGILRKGTAVVVTQISGSKVLFHSEKDPTIVGAADQSYIQLQATSYIENWASTQEGRAQHDQIKSAIELHLDSNHLSESPVASWTILSVEEDNDYGRISGQIDLDLSLADGTTWVVKADIVGDLTFHEGAAQLIEPETFSIETLDQDSSTKAYTRLRNFVKCHSLMSRSPKFLTRLATELDLPDDILTELEQIKDDIKTNRDQLAAPVVDTPEVDASARLRDAAEFFILAGKIPSQSDTVGYLKDSLSASFGLPVDRWTDETIETQFLLAAPSQDKPLEWTDKLLLLQQWERSNKLEGSQWRDVLSALDDNDPVSAQVTINSVFDEVIAAMESTASLDVYSYASEPKPSSPPPTGKKYIWDTSSDAAGGTGMWVLVDAAKSEKKKSPDIPLLKHLKSPDKENDDAEWPAQQKAVPIGFPPRGHFAYDMQASETPEIAEGQVWIKGGMVFFLRIGRIDSMSGTSVVQQLGQTEKEQWKVVPEVSTSMDYAALTQSGYTLLDNNISREDWRRIVRFVTTSQPKIQEGPEGVWQTLIQEATFGLDKLDVLSPKDIEERKDKLLDQFSAGEIDEDKLQYELTRLKGTLKRALMPTPSFDGGSMDSPGPDLGQKSDGDFPSVSWIPRGQENAEGPSEDITDTNQEVSRTQPKSKARLQVEKEYGPEYGEALNKMNEEINRGSSLEQAAEFVVDNLPDALNMDTLLKIGAEYLMGDTYEQAIQEEE